MQGGHAKNGVDFPLQDVYASKGLDSCGIFCASVPGISDGVGGSFVGLFEQDTEVSSYPKGNAMAESNQSTSGSAEFVFSPLCESSYYSLPSISLVVGDLYANSRARSMALFHEK